MNFIKHISHSLFFAPDVCSRKLRRLAVCALLAAAAAGLAQVNHRWPPQPRRAQAEQSPALSGEAAIQRLKTDGGYVSLAAAMAAARYQINAAPNKSAAPYYANNPGQRLHATFASDEVRVNTASNKTEGKPGGAELRLRLAGYGYGEQLQELSKGALTVNGDRINICKSAIRNPQSAITEWYVNKPEGLEQGFTLAAPPPSSGRGERLRIALSVGEGWRASIRGDQQGALFERQADGLRLGYDQLQAYDAHGRKLTAQMALAGDTLALLVDDAQAAYPLTIDPILTQQQKLTAADGAAGDGFGRSVALSGDTAVVGADFNDIGANADQGAAYVFTRTGTAWTLQQQLTASDGAAGDLFGRSVAISGDTVVVGAFADDVGANKDQGSAYVFIRSGAVWTQQQKLTAIDGAVNDQFGQSVAINGETVVVGAFADDIGLNTDQGSAYVFTRSGTVWTLQQKLIASDGSVSDLFGFSVAISGDTAVVGAFSDAIGANAAQGSAYVFTRGGGVWTQQQKLVASDGAAVDLFGQSVAISGDTVVVGADGDDIGANGNQGSAYVFARGGGIWTQQQKLTASEGGLGDQFGISVAISGDTLVVGANAEDLGATDQGAAYFFARSGAVWTQQRRLIADDGGANDQFGDAVAISDDTVVVGAFEDDIGLNVDQGAAYVFVICANNYVQQQHLTANDGAAFDNFGSAVALNGDTVLVGAETDDIGANSDQGSAYVFTRSGGVWTLQQKLIADDGAFGAKFGGSVAISGDTVVVGAHLVNVGANGSQGAAYVFTRNNGVWTQQQKLTASDGAAGDFFGGSVAISDDTVVVGAWGKNIGGNVQQGSAYIFTRNGTVWAQQQELLPFAIDALPFDRFGISVAISGQTLVVGKSESNGGGGSAYIFTFNGVFWTQQQKLIPNDGAASDFFGSSVAVSGDTVVVGAFGDDIGLNTDQGSAYVFTRSFTPSGAVWTQQQKFTANDGVANSLFGESVAISGDTVVVGALGDTIGANATQGAAYVFTRNGAVWTQQQKLTASDGAASDVFGAWVAISGDTVVVGAPFDDVGANFDQGSAYVFICPACPTITLNPNSLPDARAGSSYSQTVTAIGAAGPFQFSFSDGALPPGLILAQNGLLSGMPIVAGTFRFTITATDLNSFCPGSSSYTLTVRKKANCKAITINPASLPAGAAGQQYSQTLTATGGAAPFNFTISAGAIPNGMSLSSAGLLSGPPTAIGAFNFTAQVTDANGCQGTRAYSLTITPPCETITVLPGSLPGGTVGVAYNQMIISGGVARPNTFTVSAGKLPAGLSLSANGLLSGTPRAAGSFDFTVRATDTNGCQGTRSYTLIIN